MTLFVDHRPLLDAFRRGEKQALTAVFRQYVDGVERVLHYGFFSGPNRAKVPGIQDIEKRKELVHDVFVRAFSENARQRYDGLRPYEPLILTIAKNLLIDYWRKQRRDPLAYAQVVENDGDDLAQENSPVDGADSEEMLHWQRCMVVCQAFSKNLAEKQKQFIELRFQQGLPQEEVARELGLSRWKVRSFERKLCRALESALKKNRLL